MSLLNARVSDFRFYITKIRCSPVISDFRAESGKPLTYHHTSLCFTLIMGNITLTVDDETVKKVRRIALERDTTLTAMVRNYLTEMAEAVDASHLQDTEALLDTFRELSRPMGKRDWIRDDLYE